ncbi:CGG triplet repeat-binding protein 1 [Dictyocoela muelleri]|nr:CGG triplet repeat-binding protein 1 [Dictyocoela muelleri]
MKYKKSNKQKSIKYAALDKDYLILTESGNLFCTLCSVLISVDRKSQVTQHIQTLTHKKNIEQKKPKQNTLKIQSLNTAELIVKSFLNSNIPLYKLRNNSIKNMFQKLGVNLSCETTLRKLVSKLYKNHMITLKNNLFGKSIYLIIDETQFNQRKFINILMGDIEDPRNIYLTACKEIFGCVDSNIISVQVDNVLKGFNIQRENFKLFITDSAAYMISAGKNLKIFYSNLLHIYCWLHFLHNCALKIRCHYKSVDFLVSSMKNLTVKNKFRDNLFKKEIGTIPKPIITRWGTWLEAALYYSENFRKVKEIVFSFKNDGILIENARDAFEDKDLISELINIENNYRILKKYLNDSCKEYFSINDAVKLFKEIDFKEDVLNIKKYLTHKMEKSDISLFFEKKHIKETPYTISCLLNAPSTSLSVERSFSILQKILTKERQFSTENIQKYMILYYNKIEID